MNAVLFVMLAAPSNLITFDLQTNKQEYYLDEVVSWRVSATLSGHEAPNLGTHMLNFDLTTDRSLVLGAATISPAWDGYNFHLKGSGGRGYLTDVAVGMIGVRNADTVQLLEDGSVDVAFGTLSRIVPGDHVLDVTPNSTRYFISQSSTRPYASSGSSAAFTVLPEPSAIAMGLVAVVLGFVISRRRKR